MVRSIRIPEADTGGNVGVEVEEDMCDTEEVETR